MSNPDSAARSGQGRSLIARLNAARSFEKPELLTIGFQVLRQWAREFPGLEEYQQYFLDLERQSRHFRSTEVEEILAMVTEPLPNSTPQAYAALINAELPFKPAKKQDGNDVEIGQSSITSLLVSEDRVLRQTAFDHYADAYLQYKNTIAAIQTQAVQRDVFNARTRTYTSSLEASLAPNNIPLEVFHNLIEVFKQNLPTWHKYWRIRRKALGYEDFNVSDIKAPW